MSAVTPRGTRDRIEIRELSPDSRINTSLEWFSPIAEKRRWLWQGNQSQIQSTKLAKGTEIGSTDLQAGLAKAILILKEEVARNSARQETTQQQLDIFVTELCQCKDDLTSALHAFNGTFAVIRRQVRQRYLAGPEEKRDSAFKPEREAVDFQDHSPECESVSASLLTVQIIRAKPQDVSALTLHSIPLFLQARGAGSLGRARTASPELPGPAAGRRRPGSGRRRHAVSVPSVRAPPFPARSRDTPPSPLSPSLRAAGATLGRDTRGGSCMNLRYLRQ